MKNIALLIATAALLVGCTKENGEKPKAEASVHVSVGEPKDSIHTALDNAEDDIKKGAKEAKAKLEEAGDAIKEKAQAAKDKLTEDKKGEVKVEVKN